MHSVHSMHRTHWLCTVCTFKVCTRWLSTRCTQCTHWLCTVYAVDALVMHSVHMLFMHPTDTLAAPILILPVNCCSMLVHFIHVHGVHKCLSILYCALLLVLVRFRLGCLKCDTGPHIWGGGGVNPISLLGLVTTVGVVTGQNTSRGGWWGRARPALSRGRPWCSQGGEGKTGPDGVLQNLQYS